MPRLFGSRTRLVPAVVALLLSIGGFSSATQAVGARPALSPHYLIAFAGTNPAQSLSDGTGVNHQGDIVGAVGIGASPQPYVFKGGQVVRYGRPAGMSVAYAAAVNNLDGIAGEAGTTLLTTSPFVATVNGPTITWTRLLGPGGTKVRGNADGINGHGDAAGYYYVSSTQARAVFWRASTGYTPHLPSLPAGTGSSYVQSLDTSGDMAGAAGQGNGSTGELWQSSGRRDALAPAVAGDSTYGLDAIRSSATPVRILVSGFSGSLPSAATVWSVAPSAAAGAGLSAKPSVLPALSGLPLCEARAVNAGGWAVGDCTDFSSPGDAFVSHGGKTYDLNACIKPGSAWHLIQANGINTAGKITGDATYKGKDTAFVLTPA